MAFPAAILVLVVLPLAAVAPATDIGLTGCPATCLDEVIAANTTCGPTEYSCSCFRFHDFIFEQQDCMNTRCTFEENKNPDALPSRLSSSICSLATRLGQTMSSLRAIGTPTSLAFTATGAFGGPPDFSTPTGLGDFGGDSNIVITRRIGLTRGAIIGIVIGVLVFFVLIAAGIAMLVRHNRKGRGQTYVVQQPGQQYMVYSSPTGYMGPPPGYVGPPPLQPQEDHLPGGTTGQPAQR